MDKIFPSSRSVLRDMLQYMVPACMTTVVILYLYGEGIYMLAEKLINEYAIMFGILLVILTYLAGQIIYILSKLFVPQLKKWLGRCFKKRLDEINETVEMVRSLNTNVNSGIHFDTSYLSGDQTHLFAEVAVLSRHPELHSSYIERQNNLMYFTQTLCMSAFINGVVLVFHVCSNGWNFLYGMGFFTLTLILFYEYLGRMKYFYERVYITYLYSVSDLTRKHPASV